MAIVEQAGFDAYVRSFLKKTTGRADAGPIKGDFSALLQDSEREMEEIGILPRVSVGSYLPRQSYADTVRLLGSQSKELEVTIRLELSRIAHGCVYRASYAPYLPMDRVAYVHASSNRSANQSCPEYLFLVYESETGRFWVGNIIANPRDIALIKGRMTELGPLTFTVP